MPCELKDRSLFDHIKCTHLKFFFSLAISVAYSLNVCAQDPTIKDLKKETERSIKKNEKDTIPERWKSGGAFTFNLNQGALSNWAAGGDKFTLSLNSYLNLYAFHKQGKNSWDNVLDLTYGLTNTTSLGTRKSADRIDLLSKYGYALAPQWNVAALFTARTQFSKGFAYTKTASGNDTSAVISDFMSPAYIIFSLGFDYKPNLDLSIFISPASARFVVVTEDLLATKYGLDPGKNVKTEIGAFVTANYLKKLGSNFSLKSRLDLFSNYRKDPANVDIFWSNVLTASITKHINFSFTLDMIYDDNTQNVNPLKGPAPQWLELMGIGVAYNFQKK
jgi:hypothetical protein